MMTMNKYHIPVLLNESVRALNIDPEGTYVDLTYGGGSHSLEILKYLSQNGKLIAFDQDEDADEQKIIDDRFTFHAANFKFLRRFLKFEAIHQVDGILADLGISSHQIDQPQRGFSIRYDARLDMRMDQAQEFDACELINTYDEQALTRVFKEYGELRAAGKIAKTIVQNRQQEKIVTTTQLNKLLMTFFSETNKNKLLAMAYQALRIEVNQEMEALKSMLSQASEMLKTGGRLCVISYHSLEDRLVKRFFKNGNFGKEQHKDFYGRSLNPLKHVGKLILPDEEEIKNNNRARSARMRIAEKVDL
ncbi:MAG: 16S rRNA (cytosine(1402)-N(4))-methyltransferase RsmH [Psychroflexus sp.]|nr:16S rRNA (cytosine(1402)-N(4))-methyltransferase RsmH [Psychroflexus sp.]